MSASPLQVKKLKAQLEQKTPRNGTENTLSPDGEILENGNDPNVMELQREYTRAWKHNVAMYSLSNHSYICLILPGDSNRQISDFKFKLVKAEQEVTALEQNVS